MNMPDLRHHILIDVQSACRIDDEHVGKTGPGVFQRRLGNSHGLPALPGAEIFKPVFPGQHLQLFQGRRTVDIATGHHYGFAVLLPAPFAQLRNRGGLA